MTVNVKTILLPLAVSNIVLLIIIYRLLAASRARRGPNDDLVWAGKGSRLHDTVYELGFEYFISESQERSAGIVFLLITDFPNGYLSLSLWYLYFSFQVWVYIISSYIGVSFIIFFIAHVTPYEWLQTHPCDEDSESENQFNLLNSLWFTVGALMRQGEM